MVVKHKIAKLNRFGDVVCPYCSSNIIVPVDYPTKPSDYDLLDRNCPYCKKEFNLIEIERDDAIGDNFPTIN